MGGGGIVDNDIGEAKTAKATIKQFIGLIRAIFGAEVCYLYLINYEMDRAEKEEYFNARLEGIKEAYSKRGVDFPKELENCTLDDVKILKFIDIAEKGEEKKWKHDYKKRPGKYVIFKNYDKDKKILKEGLTAYIARANKLVILNSGEEIDKHESTAHLNTDFDIAPNCSMLIGFPLVDENRNVIGVLKVENYDAEWTAHRRLAGKKYDYTKNSREVKEASRCLPLLVRLIKSSKIYFSKNSYEELFGGINLLEVLKKVEPSGEINKKIYKDTLHLFFVLKRKEYIGYEEILDRISGYVTDVSKYLELTESEIESFNRFLDEFKKHEELLLYGLNDYRDHFMHQFHVFVSGYIIINKLGIEEFRSRIQNNMSQALERDIKIYESDVLRIWFLTAFYHDCAYILEKIDAELSGFFKKILGYPFSVKFNWEQLLKKESNFPKYLTQLLKYFVSPKGTNQGTLLRNYLDSIIESHDHGVLSALLLREYNSRSTERRINECLYAALAISFHTKNVYKNLMEGKVKKLSFESFPIAFLLAFCDTAQSFGRLEKREGKELLRYPVKFSDIAVEDKNVLYELLYTSDHPAEVPTDPEIFTSWADDINNVFKSDEHRFDIKYYKGKENAKEPIYTLSFH
jgi:hypothetical protein